MNASSQRFVSRGQGKLQQPRSGESDFGSVGAYRLVSRLSTRGHCFGAKPAPSGTASFCFGFATLSGSRFLPEQVCTPRGKGRRTNFFRAPPGMHSLALGSRAHIAHFVKGDPSKLTGNTTQTEITTMYQNKVTLIGFTRQRRRSPLQRQPQLHQLFRWQPRAPTRRRASTSRTPNGTVVWSSARSSAEFAATLKKGAHLQVEGELRSREYEAKQRSVRSQSEKKTIWEIRVDSILKLDRAEKSEPGRPGRGRGDPGGSGCISRLSFHSTRKLGIRRASDSLRHLQ